MTTNLHDKMLKAIDAYFSACNRDEEMEAEDLLLDVRDEIRKQPRGEATLAQQCWKCGDMDSAFQAKCDVPACGMKEQP